MLGLPHTSVPPISGDLQGMCLVILILKKAPLSFFLPKSFNEKELTFESPSGRTYRIDSFAADTTQEKVFAELKEAMEKGGHKIC